MPRLNPGWTKTLLVAGLVLAATGCTETRSTLIAPNMITAPYDALSGEVLWAVVPPVNESGTSLMDPLEVGDALVAAVSEVRGVASLPLNRTIAAMRALKIDRITSPGQIKKLAETMGVDGIVVPSVSAWDPYDPPVIGLTLALYSRSGSQGSLALDPKALSTAASDERFLAHSNFLDRPVVSKIEHLDARNHQVQMLVQEYAQGRSDSGSALNWRIYLASMDLYTDFAAYHLVRQVVQDEWLRTARVAAQ